MRLSIDLKDLFIVSLKHSDQIDTVNPISFSLSYLLIRITKSWSLIYPLIRIQSIKVDLMEKEFIDSQRLDYISSFH